MVNHNEDEGKHRESHHAGNNSRYHYKHGHGFALDNLNSGDPPPSADLPALTWLGYGIDMTTATPIAINALEASVLTAAQIVQGSDKTHDILVAGATFTVPKNVTVASDIAAGQGSYTFYENGNDAASSIEADASLSVNYMAVTASASTSYSVNKTFHSDYQYALYSYNQDQYIAKYMNYAEDIDEDYLIKRMAIMKPFDSTNADIVNSYKALFAFLGSHIITSVRYGARYQLDVWASNTDSSVDTNFSANIAAAYNGVTASGQFDASIKTTDEYKTFTKSMQKLSTCRGGDQEFASALNGDPSLYDTFTKWQESARVNPALMAFQTLELWTILDNCMTPGLQTWGPEVLKAYQWIVTNPEKHITKCRFTINSDWGEFGLLTPSAFILPDPASPAPTENVWFGPTKITFGREYSRHFEREVTIDCLISNDGSPIDIYMSHGSDGPVGGGGETRVTIDKPSYDNIGITDNVWNTKFFYQCPVNPNPVANE